jgi:rhodanese-related sulfurtransferase
MLRLNILCFLALFLTNFPVLANEAKLTEALQDYLEFEATYSDGAITVLQIRNDLDNFFIVDTRDAASYQASHLPKATNIEWRQIVSQVDALPKDKNILLYCDTGYLSSKAHFALRLMGFDNVKVLFGGYKAWQISEKKVHLEIH